MRFKTILSDPPWDYETWGKLGKHRSPENHYPVLTDKDLLCLPVEEIAAEDCVLLLWCTWPKLELGLRCLDAWGFRYRSGFPWLKLSKSMLPRMGTGYHARHCTEPLLIGTRGKPRAPEPFERQEGVLFSKLGPHSAKPDTIYERAELYDGPYCEMFARPDGNLIPFARCDWTQVGNEIDGQDIRAALCELATRPQPQERERDLIFGSLADTAPTLFGVE